MAMMGLLDSFTNPVLLNSELSYLESRSGLVGPDCQHYPPVGSSGWLYSLELTITIVSLTGGTAKGLIPTGPVDSPVSGATPAL